MIKHCVTQEWLNTLSSMEGAGHMATPHRNSFPSQKAESWVGSETAGVLAFERWLLIFPAQSARWYYHSHPCFQEMSLETQRADVNQFEDHRAQM